MTDDLVKRLRNAQTYGIRIGDDYLCKDAADAIERLRHDLDVTQSSQALAIASSDLAQHMKARVERAEAELERARVQLAGCGVIAMCNTPESLATQMPPADAYGYSDSLAQVARAVQREIDLRAERDALRIECSRICRERDVAEGEAEPLRAALHEEAQRAERATRLYDTMRAERDALRALLADIRANGINAPMEERIDDALREKL